MRHIRTAKVERTLARTLLAADVPRALNSSAVELGAGRSATTARLDVLGGVDTLVVGAKAEDALDSARLEASRAQSRSALLLMALAVVATGLRTRGLAALILPAVAGRAGRRRGRRLAGNTTTLVAVPPPGRRARLTGRRRRRVGLTTVRNAALALETPPSEERKISILLGDNSSVPTYENSLSLQVPVDEGALEVVVGVPPLGEHHQLLQK